VDFPGPVPPERVASLLSTAHALLAPSVVDRDGNRESGLIVVKEASASGAVPIGSRHGGIPEIIDDEVTGYLVAERDVDALGDRLRRLARDPDLRNSLAFAGRAKMEREYDNRVRVAALEEIYDEVRLQWAEDKTRLPSGTKRGTVVDSG
ncbi:MAG TPA: glycosyltransferase, partial [Gemmatimonadales bacterium]|nr:glycosyltransferase [Gemmatimonadales bacterium]